MLKALESDPLEILRNVSICSFESHYFLLEVYQASHKLKLRLVIKIRFTHLRFVQVLIVDTIDSNKRKHAPGMKKIGSEENN